MKNEVLERVSRVFATIFSTPEPREDRAIAVSEIFMQTQDSPVLRAGRIVMEGKADEEE